MVYINSAAPASLSSSSGPTAAEANAFSGASLCSNPYNFLAELGSGELSELSSSSGSIDNAPKSQSEDLTSILTSLQKHTASEGPSLDTMLPHAWTFWYLHPPQGLKSTQLNFESLLTPICTIKTLQDFWSVYLSLKRPDELTTGTTDFSFFKEHIRPIWEDPVNEQGGKLVIRLKKNGSISSRLWELLLLALIGSELSDIREHICGVVFSIRQHENFISIWTPQSSDHVIIHRIR